MLMTHRIEQSWNELLRGFCKLQRIQFAAPWRSARKC